jgi:hypothetical protein
MTRSHALAALSGALALAGCAAIPRATPPSPARPLMAPSVAGEHAVSQVVRGTTGARELIINCVVTLEKGTMTVVGLNAMGVRLFTIRHDGSQVVAEKGTGVPEQLTPERLIADLQLVFWPLTGLQPLRAAGFDISEPVPGTRRLRHGDRLVAEVHYAGTDPWSGRSWLVNLEFGYSLQIDSQPL